MHYILVLVVLVMSLNPLHARAEAAPEAAASTQGSDAAVQAVQEGHELAQRGHFRRALRSYRRAAEAGSDGWPLYFVGCAQRALGQLDQALATFRQVVDLAGEGDEALQGVALMNLAWVQERRRDWSAARAAWQQYIAFAESHAAVEPHAANARQRLDVITAIEDLESAYVEVRQRIAAEPERNASSSN